jgi:hypothetical protein
MKAGGKAICVAAATLATMAACAVPAGAAKTKAPPRQFFGVVPSGYDSNALLQRMVASGVGTVRLKVSWADIEPQQGFRNWTYYDNYLVRLASAGLRAQPFLIRVPPWLPPQPTISNSVARASWQGFLTDLAGRYGRNGLFWQQHPGLPYLPLVDWDVWNEPNLSGFWGGRPNARQYVRFLRLSGAALRRSDPGARVSIGGIFPYPQPRFGVRLKAFMNRVYKVRGARRAFDAVSIHPYSARPKGVVRACRELRLIMDRHRDRKTPIWVTEVGWSTGGVGWAESPFRATEPAQAAFLSSTYRKLIALRKKLRVQRVIWHAFQDAQPGTPWTLNMGLIHNDESPKPSLAAYAALPH